MSGKTENNNEEKDTIDVPIKPSSSWAELSEELPIYKERKQSQCDYNNNSKSTTETNLQDSEPKVCLFFLKGTCVFGDSCNLLHTLPENKSSVPVCSYFLKGRCKYQKDCIYRHENPVFCNRNDDRDDLRRYSRKTDGSPCECSMGIQPNTGSMQTKRNNGRNNHHYRKSNEKSNSTNDRFQDKPESPVKSPVLRRERKNRNFVRIP